MYGLSLDQVLSILTCFRFFSTLSAAAIFPRSTRRKQISGKLLAITP